MSEVDGFPNFKQCSVNRITYLNCLQGCDKKRENRQADNTAGKGLLMSTKNDLNMFAFLNQLSIL
jgi:hypothetical protein